MSAVSHTQRSLTMGRLLLSVPQFPHLANRDDNSSTYLMGVLWGLNEYISHRMVPSTQQMLVKCLLLLHIIAQGCNLNLRQLHFVPVVTTWAAGCKCLACYQHTHSSLGNQKPHGFPSATVFYCPTWTEKMGSQWPVSQMHRHCTKCQRGGLN